MPKQCDLFIESSLGCYACAPILLFSEHDSNVLCVLLPYWMRLVEVTTNPHVYRVKAVALLKHYTPDKNQATTARYYISDHKFYFDISHSNVLVTGNNYWHSEPRLYDNSYCSVIVFIDLRGDPALLYQRRLNDSQLPFYTRQWTGMLQASYQQPTSWSRNHTMLRPGSFPLARECPVTVLT